MTAFGAIKRKQDSVIGKRRRNFFGQHRMEFAWARKKYLAARYRIPGSVAQKRTAPLEKKMNLEFERSMGMIAAVPGKPVSPGKPVHEHRIYYFHACTIA